MYQLKTCCLLLLLLTCIIHSCSNDQWNRTESGLFYKIFAGAGNDSIARFGKTIKVNYIQKVGDSIMESTYETMPYYELIIPGFADPYNPSALLPGLKKGDSVVIRQCIDSMLSKKIIKSLPPYINKKDEWITTIKVMDVFSSDSLLQLDKQKEVEKCKVLQLSLGQHRIQNYLHNNKLNAADISNGIFIQPISPGKGEKPEVGKWINMQCTISTLSGKTISNADSAQSHQGPTSFILGRGFFPPPIEETLLYFRKGDHAKIYIVGTLVFGITPPRDIKLTDDLVFDIHILDVKNKPESY